jgi:phosphoribosylformylglycinamidine synthase PurS subunit
VKYGVQLLIELKDGLLDPQKKTIERALPALGWENVRGVRAGKYLRFEVDAPDQEAAGRQAREMAERFLTNPVIETYSILAVSALAVRAAPDRSASSGRR